MRGKSSISALSVISSSSRRAACRSQQDLVDEPGRFAILNWIGERLTATVEGWASCRLLQTLRRIHSPRGRIRSVSSAIGMNCGGTIAAGRMVPARQRFEADDLAADRGLRLVVQSRIRRSRSPAQIVCSARRSRSRGPCRRSKNRTMRGRRPWRDRARRRHCEQRRGPRRRSDRWRRRCSRRWRLRNIHRSVDKRFSQRVPLPAATRNSRGRPFHFMRFDGGKLVATETGDEFAFFSCQQRAHPSSQGFSGPDRRRHGPRDR